MFYVGLSSPHHPFAQKVYLGCQPSRQAIERAVYYEKGHEVAELVPMA